MASLLLALSVFVTACSGGGTKTPATDNSAGGQTAPKEKVQLRLATWAGAEESKELQAVLDKINAKSTSFQIVHEPAPADYYTKVQTMFAGNNAPDLLWLSQEYVAPYASKGALMDLTDRLGKDTRPAAKQDDYFPMVLESAKLNGKTYGLPWIAQPVIVYYNKALFQQKNVPLPTNDWTWDQFLDAAKKLTDKSKGIYGTTFNGWPPVHMFVWQAGGEVISPDLKSSPIDSPEAQKAFDFYSSIIYKDTVAAPRNAVNEQGFAEMFKAGKIAMFFGGATDDLDRVNGLDVGTVVVPKGPKTQTTFAWTASTVVNAKTKHPQEAYDALVELSDGIHNWKLLAPRKSLATKEQIIKVEPRKEKTADTIIKAAQDMRAFRIVPKQQEWDTIFWEQLQDPLYSQKGTVADLTKATRAKLEAVLPK